MIIVTNGLDIVKIESKYLQKIEDGFLIKPEFDYWMINLKIIIENKKITKIIKTLPYGERILDSFNNLNKKSDEILLSADEFNKFKKLYENMRNKIDLRKKIVIEAVAQILSYQYYQAKCLEDNPDILMDELFEYETPVVYNSKEYREEIFKRANELLVKYYL